MASPVVGAYGTQNLVTKFLHNAQTSQYLVYFKPPGGVIDYVRTNKGVDWSAMAERINIRCFDAKLPTSNFATHDVTSDFMGVTEKMAYRRIYDDTFSVSLFVDYEYKLLHFFEGWMDFIAGKQAGGVTNQAYKSYTNGTRMRYPKQYRTNAIELIKFDRDLDNHIKYSFVEGFPISMDSMPLSYGASDVLKLSVNFNFVRYVTEPFRDTSTSAKVEEFFFNNYKKIQKLGAQDDLKVSN